MATLKHPKIILLGDISVGKTALIQTLVNGQFPQKLVSTMGACFQRYETILSDGRQISMDIWDTAGQQKYRSLLMLYYKNTDVIIMVFDVTKNQTFETVSFWAGQIEQNCEKKPQVILVGNKYDLRNTQKLIPNQKIRDYARNKNWVFFYASALQNLNVREIFQKAGELALESISKVSKKTSPMKPEKIKKKVKKNSESNCC